MGPIKLIFLYCQNCAVNAAIVIIILMIAFIRDIGMLGILNNTMARQLTDQ